MIYSDKQDNDDEKVGGNDNLDDNNCDSTNTSSCSRQPCKQGSSSDLNRPLPFALMQTLSKMMRRDLFPGPVLKISTERRGQRLV